MTSGEKETLKTIALGITLITSSHATDHYFIEPVRQEVQQRVDELIPPILANEIMEAKAKKFEFEMLVNSSKSKFEEIKKKVNDPNLQIAYQNIIDYEANEKFRSKKYDEIRYGEYPSYLTYMNNILFFGKMYGVLGVLIGLAKGSIDITHRIPKSFREKYASMNPFDPGLKGLEDPTEAQPKQ